MELLLRPGIILFLKTKFPIKNIRLKLVTLTLIFSTLACSQGYVSQYDLTATALFSGDTPVPADTETATPEVIPVMPTEAVTLSLPTEAETEAFTPTALTPTVTVPTRTITPFVSAGTELPPILYYTQAGDTLPAVAARYGVRVDEITSSEPVPTTGLINAGKLLIIPQRLGPTGPGDLLIPDSEIVYSPSALDFDTQAFLDQAGGYLATYREYLAEGWYSGAQVIQKVALENSINPRLLVALVEYQSGWVYGQPDSLAKTDYPMGMVRSDKKGLYKQLNWAVQQLMIGYYGWRNGILFDVPFADGDSLRMAPQLNAGSAALQYLFAQLYTPELWNGVLAGTESFSNRYNQLYGSAWQRAQTVEPLFPVDLVQPDLILPFEPGHLWSFSGGPHSAWGPDGARAALDFAPASVQSGCVDSTEWVTAVAAGVVVRVDTGVVILDLDGDGYEQTGWNILYLHIKTQDKIKVGTIVRQGDRIGHPSCEGGTATGTHVHIARKYNGEWVLADGALPFVMNGWRCIAGADAYQGKLVKDDQVVEACDCGSFETRISRPADGSQ